MRGVRCGVVVSDALTLRWGHWRGGEECRSCGGIWWQWWWYSSIVIWSGDGDVVVNWRFGHHTMKWQLPPALCGHIWRCCGLLHGDITAREHIGVRIHAVLCCDGLLNLFITIMAVIANLLIPTPMRQEDGARAMELTKDLPTVAAMWWALHQCEAQSTFEAMIPLHPLGLLRNMLNGDEAVHQHNVGVWGGGSVLWLMGRGYGLQGIKDPTWGGVMSKLECCVRCLKMVEWSWIG